MFRLQNITVSFDNRTIVENLSLYLNSNSTHILMGPNGSGKSTLAQAIMGHPRYALTGKIELNDQDITLMGVHERARAGLFIGFQQPLELPGVNIESFLIQAYQARFGIQSSLDQIKNRIYQAFELVQLHPSFMQRHVNVGFSGGEKKRFELVQMIVLAPTISILDEIDSGLDVQGLSLISKAIEQVRAYNEHASFLIISHNTRIDQYIACDQIHILKAGQLIKSSDVRLLHDVERVGYEL